MSEVSTFSLAWALDFMDEPFTGADFKFWSGVGDLTIDGVTYRGTNGVITVQPPREKSGESIQMSVVMDATDSGVREQLRHDMGPLRVRVRWLYTRITEANPGLVKRLAPPFATFWGTDGIVNVPIATISGANGDIVPVRFTSLGGLTHVDTDTTYYAYINNTYASNQGWTLLKFFDTEANAIGNRTRNIFLDAPGQLNLSGSSDGSGVEIWEYDSDSASAGGIVWTLTGKQFIGRLSSPLLKGSKFYVDIESQISDIQRGRVLYWSNDMQQTRHPEDKGMEYLVDYSEGINTKWPS